MKNKEIGERGAGPHGLRRILVAADLGACMDRAVDRALMLVAQGGAVHFVHVAEPSLPADGVAIGRLHQAMTRLTSEIRDYAPPGRNDVTGEVLQGAIDETIVRAAAAMRAEIVVTGSPRDISLMGMIRGTVVDNVIRRANCPVLVVKARARRPYAKIAAAFDLEGSSRKALTFARTVFPGAAIEVVHVDESGGTADETAELRRRVERIAAECDTDIGRGSAEERGSLTFRLAQGRAAGVLLEQLPRMPSDLVVLGTHGRTGINNFVFGSVAETLTALLPQDTLIMRA
jgi:nucleotide-binding universal stress UspA family protein